MDLMRMLGLAFGAIDLVETADGFLFLEINPTGEWGFLMKQHQQLDAVIAQWLASPTT